MAVSQTVSASAAPVRGAQRYFMRLSGTAWPRVLNTSRAALVVVLRRNLAARFLTTPDAIFIFSLSIGSLEVDFSVAPALDGTQVRDRAFMSGTPSDTAWLGDTTVLYRDTTGSSESLAVTENRFGNAAATSPPYASMCIDGCAGVIGGVGAALFVVTVLALWVWRVRSKRADDNERKRLGIEMHAPPV